ncbi:MAG: fibronectin type III domain-containing protein [Chloroflexi bacterium]|nr:fibronectin type III domain-containing protein [Chloroflexota bacterium]
MKYAMSAAIAMVVAFVILAGVTRPPATAQGEPFAAPVGVVVIDDDTPGDVVISWDAVQTANYYRIGWVAYPDYVEISEQGGRPWSEAFAFVDVENVGQTSRTVRRLTPGVLYAFRVGSKSAEDGATTFGEWVLFTVQADTTACPTGEPVPVPDAGDYDADDDGLIEIISLAQLDAIRYDSDGNGVPDDASADAYAAAFPGAVEGMGCSSATGCIGYELMAPLDFDTNGNGEADAGDAYWNKGYGWEPINYQGIYPVVIGFDGNGHAISNLYISRNTTSTVGLFGSINADVQNVVLEGVNIMGNNYVGALAGNSAGIIYNSTASGEVTGFGGTIGGLVGRTVSRTGGIRLSSAAVSVTGLGGSSNNAGGLAGYNQESTISDSSATGDVVSADSSRVGGLVGTNSGTIISSTASGSVTGETEVGSLVGRNSGIITNSQGTGQVTCSECP